MRRTALQLLDDILEAIGNIEEDTVGITFNEFLKRPQAQGCSYPELSGYW
jgi:uncharacterized protein with HEPN domain